MSDAGRKRAPRRLPLEREVQNCAIRYAEKPGRMTYFRLKQAMAALDEYDALWRPDRSAP